MNLETWYRQTIGNDTTHAVAVRAGIADSTMARQSPDKFSPESVVKIARAYQVSVVDGLIAQGLLSPDDIRAAHQLDALHDASSEELIAEISRRIKAQPESATWDEPIQPPTPICPVSGRSDDSQEEWELRQVADREQIGELGPDEDDGA